jgi:hypothetical protein
MLTHEIYFDTAVMWITLGVLILVLGLSVLLGVTLWKRSILTVIFALITCIVPVFIAYLYCPKKYSTDSNNIYVHRTIGKIRINKDEIRYIKRLSSKDLTGVYRKTASGGLFGYFGLFNTGKHGNIHVYTGSLKDHLVFVKLKSGKQYLFSPKNVQNFLDSVTQN